ncbi:pilus assembly PilX family protein [Dyella mobilis]|uniref:Pilus assembly protein n=1 Tax=Dyella mobilis TaxID=1849582 RepID=A0ABS2KM72_9GAMM|nr:PilX N-terminal domain-containing pilus assembly protein [Dyella mobilis]MBM7132040.1 pilus assembly protein [Dyella mobilis]GLQ95975.1 hypothetical protein GCM10007863_03930 [Dyella mobilis]
MSGARNSQRGVALVVALILLVVVAIVGLLAMRGTIMQQKMSNNAYDREAAFQAAEAAIRVATARIGVDTGDIARVCGSGGVTCQANPFTDSTLPAGSIKSVAAGAASGQFTTGVSAGTPQYVVENMGNWYDTSTDTGYNQSANAAQYGAQGVSTTSTYYRITARSGDPTVVGDRAVVVLQAMVKQG